MSRPLVSYVIPAYNCAPYVTRAIESLFRQDLDCPYEIIVVNDCSTDDTLKVLVECARSMPNIRIHSHAANLGTGAARNTGLDDVRGEFVFFIDADDWLSDGAVSHLLEIALSKNFDVVACGVQTVSDDGVILPYHACDFESSGGEEGVRYFSESKIGAITNKLYRVDFLTKNGLRFVEGYYHEDIIFTAYVALECGRYGSIGNLYLNYYKNENSITHMSPEKKHLMSYVNLYLEMSKYYQTLKGRGINQRYLLMRLARNYGADEVFPKLERYALTRGRKQFVDEVFDVVVEMLGVEGVSVADIICAAFEKYSLSE